MAQIKKHILVVEDEKTLNHALRLKLEHEGYEISEAYDGEEALHLILNNRYDLILLDLIMPKVDGFGVLQRLKDTPNLPPIIVLSNLGQAEDKIRSEKLGASGFFIKADVALSEIASMIENKIKII